MLSGDRPKNGVMLVTLLRELLEPLSISDDHNLVSSA
jgi:hypothetical protein